MEDPREYLEWTAMSLPRTYQFKKSQKFYMTSLYLSILSIYSGLEKLYTKNLRQGRLITTNKNFEL